MQTQRFYTVSWAEPGGEPQSLEFLPPLVDPLYPCASSFYNGLRRAGIVAHIWETTRLA